LDFYLNQFEIKRRKGYIIIFKNSNSKQEDILLEYGWNKANPNRDKEDNSN